MSGGNDSDQMTKWTASARVRTSLSRTATCCKGQFVDPKRFARLIGRASNQLNEAKKIAIA